MVLCTVLFLKIWERFEKFNWLANVEVPFYPFMQANALNYAEK